MSEGPGAFKTDWYQVSRLAQIPWTRFVVQIVQTRLGVQTLQTRSLDADTSDTIWDVDTSDTIWDADTSDTIWGIDSPGALWDAASLWRLAGVTCQICCASSPPSCAEQCLDCATIQTDGCAEKFFLICQVFCVQLNGRLVKRWSKHYQWHALACFHELKRKLFVHSVSFCKAQELAHAPFSGTTISQPCDAYVAVD